MKMLFVVAALAISGATAAAQTEQQPQPKAAVVVIENDAPVAVTVYVVDRGAKVRLGTVTATSRAPFVIPGAGAAASFYIASTRGTYTTNTVQNVRAGDRIVVRIAPELSQSYVTR